MEKKLPKMYANKIDKKLDNNDYYYKSDSEKEYIKKETNEKGLNINQKIKNIFNSPRYVYKADVLITLKDRIITKRIIGKSGGQLITIENELIPISDIIDIAYKD